MCVFGKMFDLNHDDELDALEKTLDFGLFVQLMDEMEQEDSEIDDDTEKFDY